ncbi:hypothetical protein PNEG_01439 [Pneumocystis murina B123]|uniref:Pentacotripeptide-repeat region of PRORP domain-containing protein n=1 Tax=Pneumocystis murina (strain B123) TaxID=1069680 RepID=M7P8G8_PNEMU|nr:hypothetical protein PNEG_01439 [Pneumocystis murina B123]EMR10165.1 hypothetical protein PNEG_01439 [Pneumocystis murina B123]
MKPTCQFVVQRYPLFLYFLPYFHGFLANLGNKYRKVFGTRLYNGSLIHFCKKTRKNMMIPDSIIKESFNDKKISFQYKVSTGNLTAALNCYFELSKTGCLTKFDITKLVMLMYTHIRKVSPISIEDDDKRKLLFYLENILDDVRCNFVSDHPMIWVNAIYIYTVLGLYETGKKIWESLRSKYVSEPTSFDSRVYGAAIKLYSAMGSSLTECEALFEEAIHIININKMRKSLILYEGIIIARIENQDKKRALEGLQECLKEFKNIIKPIFFDSLIYNAVNKKDPQSVVDIVFYGLNSHYIPSPEALSKLFKELWIRDRNLLTILKIFRKYNEISCSIHIEHLNFILNALFKSTNRENQADVANTIEKVNNLLQVIYEANISPSISTFNTLISGYTYLKKFDYVEKTIEQMKQSNIPENEITLRVLLKKCGEKRDSLEKINAIWEKIVELASKNRKYIEEKDWITLLKILPHYKEKGIDLMTTFLQKYKSKTQNSTLKKIWHEFIKIQHSFND